MKKAFLFAPLLVCCLAVSAPVAFAQEEGGGNTNYAIANMEARMATLEDQMRGLNGKVEQIDYATRRLSEVLQKMQGDLDVRLSDMERAQRQQAATTQSQASAQTQIAQAQAQTQPSVETPAETNGSEEAEAEAPQQPVTGTLGGMTVRGDRVTGGTVNPKAPPLPQTPPDYGLTPQEQYDKAFALLRQASYGEAAQAFKRYIDKNPNDKLIDNAKYWYAETFYVRGKFSDAAVAFAEAFQQNPKGTKAPDALLKLGMSLGAMNKKDDACGTYDALKSKFPKASAAVKKRTEQERARLKCK
ncbi:MAG: tol-pal system protein YbgF [Proteobacteria bacterium]|jgi:tol-pal system protein YbgF|nr:tol-pal system protein YbgF [Alphaproteobacteria bacterium]NCC03690.1 tol-pal system protein YbgF [Pseudomonadota bacterium]